MVLHCRLSVQGVAVPTGRLQGGGHGLSLAAAFWMAAVAADFKSVPTAAFPNCLPWGEAEIAEPIILADDRASPILLRLVLNSVKLT